MLTGLKPGQRKVLYACLKRNLAREVKVAQLAGSVAEISAYHHGEQSLMGRRLSVLYYRVLVFDCLSVHPNIVFSRAGV